MNYGAMTALGYGATKVTKHDTNEIVPGGHSRGLTIGTAGTINVTFPDGTTADAMPAVEGFFPYNVLKVRTGGTADDIWTVV